MISLSRRTFINRSLKFATALGVLSKQAVSQRMEFEKKDTQPAYPVVIASANGERSTLRAMELLNQGADPLDAVISGVNIVEDDPDDISVGYGGLPNEDGVIQLDASVMHGPTHNAGAVAALEGIKNPSRVAKLVMERTDHVLLVGRGAQDFARAHGFKVENLLTEKSRKIWLYWKESLGKNDDWFPPKDEALNLEIKKYFRISGTINCCAVDTNGNLAGVTTTSGLSFKIPGRVGDSPIIGAGLYVDNEVGAAGSTGRGEANLKNLASFLVVEYMRNGKTPQEACLEACRRIVQHTKLSYLLQENNRVNFNVQFYAINKKGEAGGASIQKGGKMWVCDKNGNRIINLPSLYET
jgi:N4-(beta-N-acetylglucosaminyl)-L-asparaginase